MTNPRRQPDAGAAAAATTTTTTTTTTAARGARVADFWNSSSTGHQRSHGGAPGTAWRHVRARKLHAQFGRRDAGAGRDGGGGNHVDDDDGDGRLPGPKRSVAELLARPGLMRADEADEEEERRRRRQRRQQQYTTILDGAATDNDDGNNSDNNNNNNTNINNNIINTNINNTNINNTNTNTNIKKPILDGVVVYVNGSTYPAVSDHHLKHLLRDHGAHLSLYLARRSVTHVILARSSAPGLAAAKLDRELRRTAALKFVDVDWVLESVKAGVRLPEARFPAPRLAARSQQSVYRLCSGRPG